ncbi:MAG: hypothetical protein VXW15_04980 [Bdellovibrionota bacterium]|nr:hypothetical protein [Bdellovibrionota bacterium]
MEGILTDYFFEVFSFIHWHLAFLAGELICHLVLELGKGSHGH